MTPENVYQRGAVGEAEAARLAALTVPDGFSRRLLGDVRGLDVLDVGAGPSVNLGRWVERHGGRFHVIDPWEAAQRAHAEAGHAVLGGVDVTTLHRAAAIADDRFDLGHARFVLCHVRPELRAVGIRGMLRVCRERVVLVEHVGAALGGSPGAEAVKDVLRDVDADPEIPFSVFYEDRIGRDAEEAIGSAPCTVEEHRLVRPAGAFHDELLIGAQRLLLPIAGQRPDLARRMERAIETLKEERTGGEEAPPVHMPDLIALVVAKRERST